MSNLPQPGQPFPHFSSAAAIPNGDEVTQSNLSLEDFQGTPLVIVFYPRDATPGCTIEVCGFRDEFPGFKRLGVKILGVSRDKVTAHVRFIKNQNLPYPLLADPDLNLINSCHLLINKTMYGKPVTKVLRSTFALDENGIVERVWEGVTPLGHAKEVLEYMRTRA
jgi:peroxiredoxin Q/BCP